MSLTLLRRSSTKVLKFRCNVSRHPRLTQTLTQHVHFRQKIHRYHPPASAAVDAAAATGDAVVQRRLVDDL